MIVAASFDHRGVKLRHAVLEAIAAGGHQPIDLGVDTDAVRVDYPDKALELGMVIPPRRGPTRRVRVRLRRRGFDSRFEDPRDPGRDLPRRLFRPSGRQHDDMNVLCLGSEIIG